MSQTDLTWRRRSACRGEDQSHWFPEDDGSANYAKSVCARCPVRLACLTYAIDPPPPPFAGVPGLTGIWGGISAENAGRARLPKMWAEKLCDGKVPLYKPACSPECAWCVGVRRHFGSLPKRGSTAIPTAGLPRFGAGARHGTASRYGRGCRAGCDECSSAWVRHESKRKYLRHQAATADLGPLMPPKRMAA